MKTTLLLKQIDLFVQLLCLLAPITIAVFTKDSGYLMAIYFAVGAAQIISCLANKLYLDATLRSSSRTRYEKALLVVIAIGLILGGGMLIVPDLAVGVYFFFLALLFISPFLAVWYGHVSLTETNYLKKLASRRMYI